MDTVRARVAQKIKLTNYQKELVIGSLLGDEYLIATTRGYAFRVNHGLMQKEYVDWKYSKLKELTNSSPAFSDKVYYFRTVSHPFFQLLRKKFYRGRRKILPTDINKWITPFSFTVWFMDDGARERQQCRINTQSFSRKENLRLISILKAKLGILATLNRDKNKYRLRIRDVSMVKVRKIMKLYLLPSMRYKISP